jgi:hypothetical protein
VMTAGSATAVIATNYTNGYYAAGLPITEFCSDGGNPCTSNEGSDYLFSAYWDSAPSFLRIHAQVRVKALAASWVSVPQRRGVISSSATPDGTLPESGGPSGSVIDLSGNIYFSTLYNQTCGTSGGSGGCTGRQRNQDCSSCGRAHCRDPQPPCLLGALHFGC